MPSAPGAPLLRPRPRGASSVRVTDRLHQMLVDAGLSGSDLAAITSASRTTWREASPRPGIGKSNASWDGGGLWS